MSWSGWTGCLMAGIRRGGLIYCDEAGDEAGEPWGGARGRGQPMAAALAGLEAGPAAILIGPEGGFSEAERTRLRDHDFVTPVTLGPRILRAETAAMAASTRALAVRSRRLALSRGPVPHRGNPQIPALVLAGTPTYLLRILTTERGRLA